MADPSKSNLIKKVKSEYSKKLKNLEAKLAVRHKEPHQIEISIAHELKKIEHSKLSKLKSKKIELTAIILQLEKEIKKVIKEKIKKLKAL